VKGTRQIAARPVRCPARDRRRIAQAHVPALPNGDVLDELAEIGFGLHEGLVMLQPHRFRPQRVGRPLRFGVVVSVRDTARIDAHQLGLVRGTDGWHAAVEVMEQQCGRAPPRDRVAGIRRVLPARDTCQPAQQREWVRARARSTNAVGGQMKVLSAALTPIPIFSR
jgi:hypothetical protein